ncbi:MFS transporter [Klebsiella sp. WOUb02]|uniref:MFS transporter n=1 Tax=Klebsiella sp. WOUb02 TaxID=3161071 RepID=UPI003CFB6EF7
MRKYPKIRWLMIFMCFLAMAINYIDRVNLSVAAPHIKEDLGLDDVSMGLIMGAFFWTYALMQIPVGRMLDRFGERLGLTIAVAWWSVFTILTACGRGLVSMVGLRMLLGIGEAGGHPGCAKVVYSWFPKKDRATASGIFNAGPRAGSALALPLVAWIISNWDWETSFIVTGLLGIIWAVAWYVIYRTPEKLTFLDAQERQNLIEDRGPAKSKSSAKKEWLFLFRYRTMWGMMLSFFCLNIALSFFLTWFPSYLMASQGFSLKQLGTLGMIPPLVGIPASMLGGFISDWLYRKGFSLTFARKFCLVLGLLLSSVIGFATYTHSIPLIITLLSISYASIAFAAAVVWSLPADVAPGTEYVATIGGIQNFAGNLAGIISSSFTGLMLVMTHGSYEVPLIATGIICVIGALSYIFIVGKIEPLDLDKKNMNSSSRPAQPDVN